MTARPITCSCGDGLCRDCASDMRRAIMKVRSMHRPVKRAPTDIDVCEACSTIDALTRPRGNRGIAGVAYPCATIRAMDRAEAGRADG